jgi:peptide chain release factor 2
MDMEKRASALSTEIDQAIKRLHIAELEAELQKLQVLSQAADFWADNQAAQDIMKRISQLEARILPWRDLAQVVRDLHDLIALKDASLTDDLHKQLTAAEAIFSELKAELKFAGPYDDHNAIMSIYAGAGGTDAQDWAQMLLRMYTRWAEAGGYAIKTLEQSSGDEAGLKSTTLEIDGNFAYGKLKGEHGVHRLVRLSPFNADHLRQTSFAKVDVLPKIDAPKDLEIDDKDLKIDVFRSGGHGGQSVNTTDSAVRVTHLPTNLVVSIQNERSQLQNKETALTILRSKLAQLQLEQHAEKISELKGPNEQAAWGNQIRSYVLHPYKQVKDLRTGHETSDAEGVLGGGLEPFMEAYLDHAIGEGFDKAEG